MTIVWKIIAGDVACTEISIYDLKTYFQSAVCNVFGMLLCNREVMKVCARSGYHSMIQLYLYVNIDAFQVKWRY